MEQFIQYDKMRLAAYHKAESIIHSAESAIFNASIENLPKDKQILCRQLLNEIGNDIIEKLTEHDLCPAFVSIPSALGSIHIYSELNKSDAE